MSYFYPIEIRFRGGMMQLNNEFFRRCTISNFKKLIKVIISLSFSPSDDLSDIVAFILLDLDNASLSPRVREKLKKELAIIGGLKL